MDEKGPLPVRRMAVKIVTVLVLALAGWWWIATTGLLRSIEAVLDTQRRAGLEVSVASMTRSGFPLQIASRLEQVSLTDPAAQTNLRLPRISVASPVYWPGDATVRLPADPITATSPQGMFTLTSDGAQAAIELHPGPALQLEALSGTSSAIALDLEQDRVFSVQEVSAEVMQGLKAESYDIGLTLSGFALGDKIRTALQMPSQPEARFGPIVADMTVTFDRPWDRSALAATRPQPRIVTIEQMTASWAAIGIRLGGELTVAAGGIPSGALRVQVQNWQQIFELAVSTGAIPAEWRSTTERVLGAMSDAQGALDLNVTVERGQMRLGFLPLGTVPPLIIR